MMRTSTPRHWIAVASADHVANGVAHGFMQVSHGTAGPLRRISPGDRVINYSPTGTFRGSDRLQQFNAFGIVRPGEPYRFRMSVDFNPYRRDVEYLPARPASILPLLEELAFSRGRRNWGWKLRPGLVEIAAEDGVRIARAMAVTLPLGCEDGADDRNRLPDVPRRRGG